MKKYEFSDDFYQEFANLLAEKVYGRDYWSGCLDFSFYNVDIMFNTTVVVSYEKCSSPEYGGCYAISSLSPIWWSIEVYVDGEDVDHDFDFDNVKEYLTC